MKHSEFKIGGTFRTGAGLWRVTDMGTRVVVAMRIDGVDVKSVSRKGGAATLGPDSLTHLNQSEAEAEGWFKGPPYAVAECVFDEYDQRGCTPGDEQR